MSDDKTPLPGSDLTIHQPVRTVAEGAAAPLESERTVISTAPLFEPPARLRRKPPSEQAQSLVGEQLGDIRLEEFVGSGGMGNVFRGVDTRLERVVAVKVLSAPGSSDPDSHDRFEVEARSAARLDHPNIARVHYVGEERGHRYLVFEYIEGTNLRDLVYANGPLPLADALRYMLQIADALMHAWQREVVHRDIKPSNILVTPEGQAKLVDMGLARVSPADREEHELTTSGVTLGTFDYMAPEQARDPRQADVRSDIYSLGCTFFFLLVGTPPYPDGSPLQKLLQHQSGELPNLAQHRPDVAESVIEVVDTMLAKRPEDRFQNPAELLSALIAVTEQLGIATPNIVLPASAAARQQTPARLQRHIPWLVPVALLLLSVLTLGIVWHRQQPAVIFPELQIDNSQSSAADQSPTHIDQPSPIERDP